MADAKPPDLPAPPAAGHESGRCCYVPATVRRKACEDHAAAGVPRNQRKDARAAVKALTLEQVIDRCHQDGLLCSGCLDKLPPRMEAKLAKPPHPGHSGSCQFVSLSQMRSALGAFRGAQPSSSAGAAEAAEQDAHLDRDALLALCQQHGLLCAGCLACAQTRTRSQPEGFLKRKQVEDRVMAALNLSRDQVKRMSKTALLDAGLQAKAVLQQEYEASLPEFMRQVKAYLHSVLDPRLHGVVDQYVQAACAIAARGSRALNLRIWQDVVDGGPEAALDLILNDTWVKQMVWPGSSAPQDVQQWWQQHGHLLDHLVLDSQLIKFLPTRDQMTAFFQRAYIGTVKAHVHAHMAERLVALFQAEHGSRSAPVPGPVIKAMLTNSGLDALETPWPLRVAAFRTGLGVDDDLTFQGREVVDVLVQQQGGSDDEEEQEAEAGGPADAPDAGDAAAGDPAADEGAYDGEDQDDEEAEAVQKSLLRRLWPLHCRLAQALWDKRAQQVLQRQATQAAPADKQSCKQQRRERPPKLVPTISLLPVTRYARTYVPIDSRMMAKLIRIHNKQLSKQEGEKAIPVPSEDQALVEMVQAPSKQALRQRRKQLRRLQKRMRPGAKKRAAACGLGLRAWPRGGELTSIRTDGVGVSLCFTIRGRKPARTVDSLADAQQALEGCTRIALGGIDPGSKNMGALQAAYLPDELGLTASPDDFWWRDSTAASCACNSGSTCSCMQQDAPKVCKQLVKTDGCVLSAGTYYARSLIRQQQRWQKARRRANPVYVHACSSLSEAGTWRTPDLQAFRAMCVRLNENAGVFRAYDLEPVDAAKRRMLLFRRKRSLLDQSAQRMVQTTMVTAAKAGKAADAVVIGYGNASKKTPRGCAPVPHKELKMAVRRALDRIKAKAAQGRRIEQKGPRVVLMVSVDEFRTTMLCHVCHQQMTERHIKLPGRGRLCPDRNFRFCSQCGTTTEGARKRSRDGNAADNMLFKAYIMIKGLELPVAFQRPSQAQQHA